MRHHVVIGPTSAPFVPAWGRSTTQCVDGRFVWGLWDNQVRAATLANAAAAGYEVIGRDDVDDDLAKPDTGERWKARTAWVDRSRSGPAVA